MDGTGKRSVPIQMPRGLLREGRESAFVEIFNTQRNTAQVTSRSASQPQQLCSLVIRLTAFHTADFDTDVSQLPLLHTQRSHGKTLPAAPGSRVR